MGTARQHGEGFPDGEQEGPTWQALVDERLSGLERRLDSMARVIRTGRFSLVDDAGQERLVAMVAGEVVELRLETTGGADRRAAVVLFASGGKPDPDPVGQLLLGPAVGLQLWAEGDAMVEIDATPDGEGRWGPHLHLGGV